MRKFYDAVNALLKYHPKLDKFPPSTLPKLILLSCALLLLAVVLSTLFNLVGPGIIRHLILTIIVIVLAFLVVVGRSVNGHVNSKKTKL